MLGADGKSMVSCSLAMYLGDIAFKSSYLYKIIPVLPKMAFYQGDGYLLPYCCMWPKMYKFLVEKYKFSIFAYEFFKVKLNYCYVIPEIHNSWVKILLNIVVE